MLLPSPRSAARRFEKLAHALLCRVLPAWFRDVEPDEARVAPEPGLLVTDIAMGVVLDARDCGLETAFAPQVGKELSIAQTAHGGGRFGHGSVQQCLNLCHESALDLVMHAGIDGLVEPLARHGQADLQRV